MRIMYRYVHETENGEYVYDFVSVEAQSIKAGFPKARRWAKQIKPKLSLVTVEFWEVL